MTRSTVTAIKSSSIVDNLDVQYQLHDLYQEQLSSVTLWHCVAECRRALETIGLATAENTETLASYTVQNLITRSIRAAG